MFFGMAGKPNLHQRPLTVPILVSLVNAQMQQKASTD